MSISRMVMAPLWLAIFYLDFMILTANAQISSQLQNPSQSEYERCTSQEGGDAGISACTLAIEQETRDSAERKAYLLTLRARALLGQGKAEEAVADFTTALETDPNYLPAFLNRAEMFRARDQCSEAIADYDKILAQDAKHMEALLGRATCRASLGTLDTASADIKQVLEADPKNESGFSYRAWQLKGKIESLQGDQDAALQSIEKAMGLRSPAPELYVERGLIWAARREYTKATADYDEAIKLDPQNKLGHHVNALILKADNAVRTGDLEGAYALYSAAIGLSPENSTLYLDRAAISLRRNQSQLAQVDLDTAVARDPQNSLALVARANYFRSLGQYPRALVDYDEAVKNNAEDLNAHGERGLVHFYMGDYAKAASDFEYVVTQQPRLHAALFLYISKRRLNNLQAARTDLDKVLNSTPNDWPRPVAELLLDRRTLEATLASAKGDEQRCEGDFYAGEWHALRGNKLAAQKLFAAVQEKCPPEMIEHRGAVEELKRLK